MQVIAPVAIEFYSHTLITLMHDGHPHVAMRPICESIGLDWKAQHARIARHPILSTCVVITTTQLPGDTQARQIVIIPLKMLNGWLFGVNVKRARPEIQEALLAYQRECFDVLARYWQGAEDTEAVPAQSSQPAPELLPLSLQRWLTTYDSAGQQHTCLLPIDNLIMNTAEFIDHVSHLSEHDIPTPQLLQLTMKLMNQLGKRKVNFAGLTL